MADGQAHIARSDEGQAAYKTLTAPQLLALRVAHDAGRPVRTWRQASRATPTPCVNFRAADSLDRLGLLRLRLTDGHYGYYEVICTAAGCAALAEALDDRSSPRGEQPSVSASHVEGCDQPYR